MDKKTLTSVIVILIVVVGGIFLYQNLGQKSPSSVSGDVSANQTTIVDSTKVSNQSSEKSFTVTGSNFAFAPKEIKVKKGDTVKITFVNSGGFHDFRIDEFNVATKQIKDGVEEVVIFVADKTGSFEYYCSVGTHRAMGMWGTLIVE